MESHPILHMLPHWVGRGATQLAFEARGYTLHKAWQSGIVQFCGEQQKQLLNQYWDEVSVETMRSLGRSNPDKRLFKIKPCYRSAFLDELFPSREDPEPPFRYPPLVKCL